MTRTTLVAFLAVAVTVGSASGCGVPTTDVTDGGRAPTGVAAGPTLYFLDRDGDLTGQRRATGRLGTVADAVSLLLTGPGETRLRTDLLDTGVTRVQVAVSDDVIDVIVPVSAREAGERGADQIACTAIAAYVQGGGSIRAKVRIDFTIGTPGSGRPRTCPIALSPGG